MYDRFWNCQLYYYNVNDCWPQIHLTNDQWNSKNCRKSIIRAEKPIWIYSIALKRETVKKIFQLISISTILKLPISMCIFRVIHNFLHICQPMFLVMFLWSTATICISMLQMELVELIFFSFYFFKNSN